MAQRTSKALCAAQARSLMDIPNIGVALAADLRSLGIATPEAVRAVALQAAALLGIEAWSA